MNLIPSEAEMTTGRRKFAQTVEWLYNNVSKHKDYKDYAVLCCADERGGFGRWLRFVIVDVPTEIRISHRMYEIIVTDKRDTPQTVTEQVQAIEEMYHRLAAEAELELYNKIKTDPRSYNSIKFILERKFAKNWHERHLLKELDVEAAKNTQNVTVVFEKPDNNKEA